MAHKYLIHIIFFLCYLKHFFVYADFAEDIVSAPNQEITAKEKNKQENHSKAPPESPKNLKQNIENQKNESKQIANHDSKAPVSFTGKFASGSAKKGMFILEGNSVISQDRTTVYSDTAEIYGTPHKAIPLGGKSTSVKKALAKGNVHIVKNITNNVPDLKATCDEVEFLVPEHTLILKGRAKVWKAGEFVHAEIITLDLKTGDISLKSPKGTVTPGEQSSLSSQKDSTNTKF